MAFLELANVSKSFGEGRNRTEVLRDISLSVEEGEFVAVVGYSGAGKSTLMSLVAGLAKPDKGEVRLGGKVIDGPGPDRGVVFQNYSLLPWLSVFENVELAVNQVFPDWKAKDRHAYTEKYVRMVNLGPASEKKPGQLSGGMRQRVSLARALAMDPKVLLMDEPLSALDALTRPTLQDEIERIFMLSKKTVLLITNDVDEGIRLADRIVPLSAGPRATLGDPVLVDLPRPRDRRALNHHPRFKEIRAEIMRSLIQLGPKTRSSVRPPPAPSLAEPLEVGA